MANIITGIRNDVEVATLLEQVRNAKEHTGIPVRTLEDWEAARRTPLEYIPRLLAYQIKFEGIIVAKNEVKEKRNVSVIQDADVNWRDTGTNSNLVAPKNYESVGF